MKLLLGFLTLLIFTGNKIEVKDAWVRTGAEGLNSALYFKIENNSDKPDTLFKVSSDAAQVVQIHETYKENDMMGMREVKYIAVKPHSATEFKPGSYHVMLMNLKKDLKKGDTIEFTLHFISEDNINIQAKVETR